MLNSFSCLTFAALLLVSVAGADPRPSNQKPQPAPSTTTHTRPAAEQVKVTPTPAPVPEQATRPELQRDNIMWPGSRTTLGPGTSFPGSY